jgi:hypothetical protein
MDGTLLSSGTPHNNDYFIPPFDHVPRMPCDAQGGQQILNIFCGEHLLWVCACAYDGWANTIIHSRGYVHIYIMCVCVCVCVCVL